MRDTAKSLTIQTSHYQLTIDGHVNIIVDNIEHSHDSGIHVVRDSRIVDDVTNDSDMLDTISS